MEKANVHIKSVFLLAYITDLIRYVKLITIIVLLNYYTILWYFFLNGISQVKEQEVVDNLLLLLLDLQLTTS